VRRPTGVTDPRPVEPGAGPISQQGFQRLPLRATRECIRRAG
jgi:hypothetical protein